MCAEFFSNRKLREISESQAAVKRESQAGRKNKNVQKLPSEKLRILYLAPGPEETSIEAKYAQAILSRLTDSGEKVFFLPFTKGAFRWLRYFFCLIKQVPRCDVIHLNLTRAGTFSSAIAPVLVLAKFFGKATALYIIMPDSELLIYRWPRITGSFLRLTSLVVAPDRYLCELVRDIGACAISAPSIPEFSVQRSAQSRQIQPRILVTDPFTSPAGFPLALQVFAHVKEKYPRTELTFCVDKSERHAHQRALESIEIPGVETVRANCALDRQTEFLRHDIYLQTPGFDNSHLKLFEALAAGIPVVSSNPGGVQEFVTDRIHAHVVDCDDHVALAERIIEVVEDPAAAAEVAASGRERARELGDVNPIKIWRQIYQALALRNYAQDGELILEPVKR